MSIFKGLPAAEERRRFDALVKNGYNLTAMVIGADLKYEAARTWWQKLRHEFKKHKVSATPITGSRLRGYFPTDKFWADMALERADPEAVAAEPAIKPDKDAVREARRDQEFKRLKRERDAAIQAAIVAQDYRTSVFGLTESPLEPVSFQPLKSTGKSSPETIIVNLSDWQWGEVVKLDAMDGLNMFDPTIAARRAERCFQAILDLATKHWAGPPPARLIVIIGGDMVSGDIHLELTRTNALGAIPAVREVVTHFRAGLQLLLNNLECPIDVISLPGNHGRSTFKNESKLLAESSYDNLVADFLQSEFRDEKRVTFYVPASGDAVFSVYGWKFLATHGHNIGSRGGMGFVGVAATAARGFKRLIMDYAARGTHIDTILIGHFHTALKLEEGYVNGTLVGPSEYSRDGRFRPQPATQLFLAIHPRRGVSQFRFINVGAPEEGTLYERPEPPLELERPRYRVRAVSAPIGPAPEQFNREGRLGGFKI